MSDSAAAIADTVITEADVAEYKRRLDQLRALMRERGFDAFIANDLGGVTTSFGSRVCYEPVRYLCNFSILGVPLTVVIPVVAEPVLILKPGFNHGFVAEAQRQSWIRNVVGLDVGTSVAAIEAYDSKAEEAAAMAAALKSGGVERGRIAVFGSWPAVALLKELLPNARFESAPLSWYPVKPPVAPGSPPLASFPRGPFEAISLSEWQINRLEEAAHAGQAALLAYIAAARRDETLQRAACEARAAAYAAGADSIELFGTVSADPWRYWTMNMASPDARFQEGHMYLIQCGRITVNGYDVQIGRSFTIGDPTPAQRHLMDWMRFGVETIMAELEIGKTGREIWEAVAPVIERQGLAEWSQYGHAHGPTGPPISFSQVMTGSADGKVCEGAVFDVHPTLYDPVSRDYGMSGDCVAIHNGKVRNLARNPLPHDLL